MVACWLTANAAVFLANRDGCSCQRKIQLVNWRCLDMLLSREMNGRGTNLLVMADMSKKKGSLPIEGTIVELLVLSVIYCSK